MTDYPSHARLNLEKAAVLLLDDTPEGASILVQITTGFGVKKLYRCASLKAAQDVVSQSPIDLALVSANMRDDGGYDFIDWLRRSGSGEDNRFTPTIVLCGHTKISNVRRARDCGANFTVVKPVSPAILLERVIWIAREKRPFVMSENYSGPDRRFRDDGPPEGLPGRRAEDRYQRDRSDSPPEPEDDDQSAPRNRRDVR